MEAIFTRREKVEKGVKDRRGESERDREPARVSLVFSHQMAPARVVGGRKRQDPGSGGGRKRGRTGFDGQQQENGAPIRCWAVADARRGRVGSLFRPGAG
jgi:hypothetical protein